jgi:hypothetical protein
VLILMNCEVFMVFIRFFSMLALAWGLLLPLAQAQSLAAPASAARSPGGVDTAPTAQGGAWRYVSVFAQYQPYAEQALASWPDANATVQRIGGWRAYAREMQAPAAAPAPAGATP